MAAQFERWSARIDHLADDSEGGGRRADIIAQLRIDEFRLLRAVVRARLDEYLAAPHEQRESLVDGLAAAWSDLSVAIRSRKR
jgi:hypothetical protein